MPISSLVSFDLGAENIWCWLWAISRSTEHSKWSQTTKKPSYLESILSYTASWYIYPRLWDHSLYIIFFFAAGFEKIPWISVYICIWRSSSKQNQVQYIQWNLSLLMMTCIWGTYYFYQAGTFPAFVPDSQFRHLKRLKRCFSIHTTATLGSASRKRKVYNVRQKHKEFRTLWIRFWFLSLQLITCLPISCKIHRWCNKLYNRKAISVLLMISAKKRDNSLLFLPLIHIVFS